MCGLMHMRRSAFNTMAQMNVHYVQNVHYVHCSVCELIIAIGARRDKFIQIIISAIIH